MDNTVKTKVHHIIVLTEGETMKDSWMKDASTFALFAALIGLGVLLDSAAMQWAGLIVAFITVTAQALGKGKKLTILGARRYLDSLEQEQEWE